MLLAVAPIEFLSKPLHLMTNIVRSFSNYDYIASNRKTKVYIQPHETVRAERAGLSTIEENSCKLNEAECEHDS